MYVFKKTADDTIYIIKSVNYYNILCSAFTCDVLLKSIHEFQDEQAALCRRVIFALNYFHSDY